MKRSLRLMQYNLENFFIYIDKELPSSWPNISEEHWQTLTQSTLKLKPLEKIKNIKCLINKQSPDIIALCEVGGKESLEKFNRLFLDNQYDVQIIEGNSDRGIDLGYLVKKSTIIESLLISHKERPINFLYEYEKGGSKKSHYFSRDVSELRVFNKNDHSPLIVILNVHLKSKLDPDQIDPEGRARRAAELKTLIDIYLEVENEMKGATPIIITGDFNGIANSQRKSPEFLPIYDKTQLIDIMELVDTPIESRPTQIIFNSLNQAIPVQIDYMFIDKKFKSLVKAAFTCSYFDKGGLETPQPKNINQRAQLPSDHYPIVCDLLL